MQPQKKLNECLPGLIRAGSLDAGDGDRDIDKWLQSSMRHIFLAVNNLAHGFLNHHLGHRIHSMMQILFSLLQRIERKDED